jgi:hypothetical protein
MHSLLDISELRLQRGVPNEIMQAAAADPLSHFA